MQNGFFDELLNEEQNNTEEVKQESVESQTDSNDVEEFNFGDFSNQNQPKQENVVNEESKQELKSSQEPQTAQNFNFSNEKVDLPKKDVKVEEKPKNEKKVETPKADDVKQPATNQVTNSNTPVVKKDFNQALIESTLSKITDIVTYSNEIFTPQAKINACDIITTIDHNLNERGYRWNQIDAKGSGLIMQIKKWAKLGVDCSTDKLYADIRANNKTGMNDIRVKAQYQTIEKLMILYCRKRIVKYRTEVICVGDELKTHFNYETGEEKIIDFIKNPKANRNSLDEITGAFKIAYIEENDGRISQIVTIIEKDRIARAMEAAKTANVWNRDTQKMVKKTVTWEMFNGEDIRPFMEYPVEIADDLKIVNENEDVDFNKEHKYATIESADSHAYQSLGSGDEVNFN